MHNTKSYLKFFKPIKPGVNSYFNFKNQFMDFDKFYKANTPTNSFVTYPMLPKLTDYKERSKTYIKILKALSLYMGIKIMYRDQLDETDSPVKGYYLIGDSQRVDIVIGIHSFIVELIEDYVKSHKEIGYSSIDFDIFTKSIIGLLKDTLVIDINYTSYLEKHIQLSFKLDYKNYNGDKHEYYHAISNRYYDKRVML